MICHTQGEQANYYTTDEPMICQTQGEQANVWQIMGSSVV
jgi:hypothetical protein